MRPQAPCLQLLFLARCRFSQTADQEGSIQYDPFTSAAAALKESGRGSLLTKLDLKDTYRHIPVCSTDWNLLGFHWMGKLYYPVILIFRGGWPHTYSTFCVSAPLDNPKTHS